MFCFLNETEWCGEKFPLWAVKTIFYQHQVYLLWQTTDHLWLVELPPAVFPAAPSSVWAPPSVFRVRAPVYPSNILMHTHIPLSSNSTPNYTQFILKCWKTILISHESHLSLFCVFLSMLSSAPCWGEPSRMNDTWVDTQNTKAALW